MTLHELAALLGKRIVEVYIPLLFLMSEGKLVLRQEEFFGEIMVSACPAGRIGTLLRIRFLVRDTYSR